MQSLVNAVNVAELDDLPELARSLGRPAGAALHVAAGIIHGLEEFPREIAPTVAPATLERQIATWIERLPPAYSIYERDVRAGTGSNRRCTAATASSPR